MVATDRVSEIFADARGVHGERVAVAGGGRHSRRCGKGAVKFILLPPLGGFCGMMRAILA